MANSQLVSLVKRGPKAWNVWRQAHPKNAVDLSRAELIGANLTSADLRNANLRGAHLIDADLSGANLTKADLSGAHLTNAILAGTVLYAANLDKAELTGAFLRWADLSRAVATSADFSDADLRRTHLARTNFEGANLSGVKVYGTSAWDLNLSGATQWNILITDEGRPEITVDNLEVAQFVYLLVHNEGIREVIDTIGKKAVLILGRFSKTRKAILDAIRQELRRMNYIPILFDFGQPALRDLTETVSTLAHLSRFIIADLTDAKIVLTFAACGTFWLAGKIVGMDHGIPSWTTIHLFFFVTGLLAFLVCITIFQGEPKKFILPCMLLALLPEVAVLGILAAFIVLPLLLLLGIVGFIKSKSPVRKSETPTNSVPELPNQSPTPSPKGHHYAPPRKPF